MIGPGPGPLRAERLVQREQFLDRLHGKGTRKEVPLRVRAAETLQLMCLVGGLDTFSDDAGVERPGERQDALHDGRPIGEQQAAHEGPIDLEPA